MTGQRRGLRPRIAIVRGEYLASYPQSDEESISKSDARPPDARVTCTAPIEALRPTHAVLRRPDCHETRDVGIVGDTATAHGDELTVRVRHVFKAHIHEQFSLRPRHSIRRRKEMPSSTHYDKCPVAIADVEEIDIYRREASGPIDPVGRSHHSLKRSLVIVRQGNKLSVPVFDSDPGFPFSRRIGNPVYPIRGG